MVCKLHRATVNVLVVTIDSTLLFGVILFDLIFFHKPYFSLETIIYKICHYLMRKTSTCFCYIDRLLQHPQVSTACSSQSPYLYLIHTMLTPTHFLH